MECSLPSHSTDFPPSSAACPHGAGNTRAGLAWLFAGIGFLLKSEGKRLGVHLLPSFGKDEFATYQNQTRKRNCSKPGGTTSLSSPPLDHPLFSFVSKSRRMSIVAWIVGLEDVVGGKVVRRSKVTTLDRPVQVES